MTDPSPPDHTLHGVPAPDPDTLIDAQRAVLVFMTSPNYRPCREIERVLRLTDTPGEHLAPLLDGKWIAPSSDGVTSGVELTSAGWALVTERGGKVWMPASFAHLLDVYDDPRVWSPDIVFGVHAALERCEGKVGGIPRVMHDRLSALGWIGWHGLTRAGENALAATKLSAGSRFRYPSFTEDNLTRSERFLLAAMALPDFDPTATFHRVGNGEDRLLDAGLVELVPFMGYALSAKGWAFVSPVQTVNFDNKGIPPLGVTVSVERAAQIEAYLKARRPSEYSALVVPNNPDAHVVLRRPVP
jgi:hypothetical protein